MQDPADFSKEAEQIAKISSGIRVVADHIREPRLLIDETCALMKKVDEVFGPAIIRERRWPPTRMTGDVDTSLSDEQKARFNTLGPPDTSGQG